MKKILKWSGITIVVLFVALAVYGSTLPEPPKPEPSPSPLTQAEAAKPQESAPSPTPEPIKPIDIKVTSQIVKKVNGKHRYFFDIRNHDSTPFEGSVTIALFNDKQKSGLGGETFSTQQPIEPTLGTSVHFDINTGPKSVHGEYGITKFTYVVKQGDKEVARGEGSITDKYENLSQ